MLDFSRHAPDHPALIHEDETWTYAELDRRASRLARNLVSEGVEPGDRVATLLSNSIEVVTLYLAAWRAGFTLVPFDARYCAAQMNYALRHCGAKVLITEPGRVDDVAQCESIGSVDQVLLTGAKRPVIKDSPGRQHPDYRSYRRLLAVRPTKPMPSEFRDDDVAVVFYTSGTTDRPKGVTLTREAISVNVSKASAVLRLTPQDVTLIASPVSRPMALRTQLLPTLEAGGTVVLLNRFEPDEYLAALHAEPAKTFVALLPFALRQVLFHEQFTSDTLRSVRLAICGGDHTPPDLFQKFQEVTGLELTEQCGMTETGMYAVNPPYGRKKRGSAGLPYYGTQLAIYDDDGNDLAWGESGEIVVRSPFAMDGYWNDTAATRRVMRDGWIRTGDIGHIDNDGFLWLDGRRKDIIVRGGSNISPAAVESVLQKHPAVREACVIGDDDKELGQIARAYVTLAPGASANTVETELMELAVKELPDYMVPDSVSALPKMPRTGSGKLDRARLKWIAASIDEEVISILLSD